jgi:NhaB family Na+:H+ antiporter
MPLWHLGAAAILSAYWSNFLGIAPDWYKRTILAFLILNPILFNTIGPFATGWILVLEFIFTLAMALKCYPLQPGGLLTIEAVVIGMTHPDSIRAEVFSNFPVILLLMFMVAGIYFMKELLLFTFTKIILGIRSKTLISLLFSMVSAFLSAFLDALTVTAVIISVALGFYAVYHKVASGFHFEQVEGHDHTQDHSIQELHREDLDQFRAFLRSLLMHGAVGTALGGVCTTVGEPQNLLIAGKMGWEFGEFFVRMVPITMPVLAVGLTTCILLERIKRFGYGVDIPLPVREILEEFDTAQTANRTPAERARLTVQAFAAVVLMVALAFHWAEVGIIGLTVIVIQTALNGVIQEHHLGRAFEEALPFTALLVVFFAIVAVIHDLHLFAPLIDYVLALDLEVQPAMFYLANGALSAISDNVFVATIYINEVREAFDAQEISRAHFERLAIAINTGTNIPSVATPNGQAAFLFLLTSSIAPLIRLSYTRMVVMAFPYTVTMGVTGYLCVAYLL